MDRKRIQCLSNASQHVPIYHLQPFLRYSELLVENCDIFRPHLCLAAPQGLTPLEFCEYLDIGLHKTRMNGLFYDLQKEFADNRTGTRTAYSASIVSKKVTICTADDEANVEMTTNVMPCTATCDYYVYCERSCREVRDGDGCASCDCTPLPSCQV